MDQNRETITYEPRKIIQYIKEKGHITYLDIKTYFEYDDDLVFGIIIDLMDMGIITRREGPNGYIVQGRKPRAYYLTEQGKDIERWPEKREAVLKGFPVFYEVFGGLVNYMSDILRVKGATTSSDAEEALKSGDLDELTKRAQLDILGNLNPEELRQYGREIERFRGNRKG